MVAVAAVVLALLTVPPNRLNAKKPYWPKYRAPIVPMISTCLKSKVAEDKEAQS